MTALDEVLVAEKEAAEMIATAKEQAAVAVAAAQTEQQEVLTAETAALADTAAAAAAAEEARVAKLAKDITAEAEHQVALVAEQFADKQGDLLTLVATRFQ